MFKNALPLKALYHYGQMPLNRKHRLGATTLSIITLSQTTLSIMTLSIYDTQNT